MSNTDKTFSFKTQQKQKVKSNTNVLILTMSNKDTTFSFETQQKRKVKSIQMCPYHTVSNKEKTFSLEAQQEQKVKSNKNLSISQWKTKIIFFWGHNKSEIA